MTLMIDFNRLASVQFKEGLSKRILEPNDTGRYFVALPQG